MTSFSSTNPDEVVRPTKHAPTRHLANSARAYYELTKPGIIYGNAIAALGGFFLASRGALEWRTLLAMLAGLSLVIGSGCTFNNYFEQDLDTLMARTKNRPLPRGAIAPRAALVYAILLGSAGTIILALGTTRLATLTALLGLFAYVVLYTLLTKRRTAYATHIGALAGATPPVVGYVAISGHFDLAALILFLMLVLWQMPHFFAIALFRREDYAAAKIPVWPLVKGIPSTKRQTLSYVILFGIASVLLYVFDYTGIAYGAIATILSITWVALAVRGFSDTHENRWAKRVFFFSLIVLTVLCATMALDAHTPKNTAPAHYVPTFV